MQRGFRFRWGTCRGLSLVEVLVAVGICAVAVVAAVTLFGPAVRATREVGDRRAAARLAERIDTELRREGFAAVAAATEGGAALRLVARADGSRIVPIAEANNDPDTGAPLGIPAAERYFDIAATRALRPASNDACVVLEVRVRWPLALPPDGVLAPEAQRSEYRFHMAIDR
jgi:type II secretory pathway pseudopilin PulG